MRPARTSLAILLLAGAALAATACAASTGTSGGSFVVPVEVENNLGGLSGASIYINRSTGTSRRLLGPVESGRTRTFEYDARAGFYRLVARPGMSQDSIVSETFQLQPGMYVRWLLPTNRLLTGSR